jgi:hypothetical protein
MQISSILGWARRRCVAAVYSVGLLLLCFAAPMRVHAQTLTTLHSFDYTDGAVPLAGLRTVRFFPCALPFGPELGLSRSAAALSCLSQVHGASG